MRIARTPVAIGAILALVACQQHATRESAAPAIAKNDAVFGDSAEGGSRPVEAADAYQWLEDVTAEKSLAWVRERNAESSAEITAAPGFAALKADLLKIADSDAKIPAVVLMGGAYYNFWKDASHRQGLWRRTTPAEFRKAAPKWETVLDLDALSAAEHESWVWHGADCLKPEAKRCLLSLSRGGADAQVVREFDLASKSFVAGGFELPEAKGSLNWIDVDHVFASTDFGADSMTSSGYPRTVRFWTRGTPLAKAVLVDEVPVTYTEMAVWRDHTPGFPRNFALHIPEFFRSELFLVDAAGIFQRVDVPPDAEAGVKREWLTIQLRSDWTVGGRTYRGGSLLVTRFDDFMTGKRDLTVLFEPTATRSLASITWTRNHLIVNLLDDVKSRLVVHTPGKNGWQQSDLVGAPALGTVTVAAVDEDANDDYFMTVADFLTPPTLRYGSVGKAPVTLKSTPAFFDTKGLSVSQHFATSKDGTRVPYYQIGRADLVADGSHPTLQYGYGGFEVSLLPAYSANAGRAWLSQGGVYVIANIRGGGEYGPAWHEAALKAKRLRAYEDFAAVSEDLIARKITSTPHLGIQGGSNGGLLMGNMFTLYPNLYGAVVCQVPLLDMKRYSHLLAGASWMAEYGDPDQPDQWQYIQTYSPYHNVKKGTRYPPILFTTSTRDDRVHPGHARKMMAKMKDAGADVRYYENIEGGHGGAANNQQSAHMAALAYTFLWQKLK